MMTTFAFNELSMEGNKSGFTTDKYSIDKPIISKQIGMSLNTMPDYFFVVYLECQLSISQRKC